MPENSFEERNRQIFESFPNTYHKDSIAEFDYARGRRLHAVLVVAASLCIPFAVLSAVLLKRDTVPQSVRTVAESVEYYVENGVKGSVTLPDGSQVALNSGSRLQILSDFKTGDRSVFLNGEGWFEVEADPAHPFYVSTPSGATVKVTGTRFNLSNYSDEDFNVLLVKGSLEVNYGDRGQIRIEPSQQLTISPQKAVAVVADDDEIRDRTAWREGRLVFDSTPMSEAVRMIGRWYGVDIEVTGDGLQDQPLTGEFDTETLSETLSVLALTHRFNYNIDGKTVTLTAR